MYRDISTYTAQNPKEDLFRPNDIDYPGTGSGSFFEVKLLPNLFYFIDLIVIINKIFSQMQVRLSVTSEESA